MLIPLLLVSLAEDRKPPSLDWSAGAVKPSGASIEGQGTWTEVDQTLRQLTPQLDACWLNSAALDPYVNGAVVVVFQVWGGKARKPLLRENSTGDEELAECLTEVLLEARYLRDLDATVTLPLRRMPRAGRDDTLGSREGLVEYMRYQCRGPYDESTPREEELRVAWSVRRGQTGAVTVEEDPTGMGPCVTEKLRGFPFPEACTGDFVLTLPLELGGKAPPERGNLPEAVIRTVAGASPRFKACATEARQGGKLQGEVEVVFTVSSVGRVAEAEVLSNTTGSDALGGCLAGVFLELGFPVEVAGEHVYPLFFDYSGS